MCLEVWCLSSQESRLEPRGSDASALGRQMSGMQVNDLLGLGSEPGSVRSPATDDPFQVGPVLLPSPCSWQGSINFPLGICIGVNADALPCSRQGSPALALGICFGGKVDALPLAAGRAVQIYFGIYVEANVDGFVGRAVHSLRGSMLTASPCSRQVGLKKVALVEMAQGSVLQVAGSRCGGPQSRQ